MFNLSLKELIYPERMVYNPATLEGQMTVGAVPGDTIQH
jgi:hypothetical protein